MNKIYIPLATGQTVPVDVIAGIELQTIKPIIVTYDSPGEINSEHNYSKARIKGEIVSRNMCIDEFLKTTDKYFFMQSRDVMQLKQDNFANMISFMNANRDFGACALRCRCATLDHIIMATICIAREVVEKGFKFANRYGWCPCREMMEDIKILGYKYGYISPEILVLNGKGN
jgi:hypothetical protein